MRSLERVLGWLKDSDRASNGLQHSTSDYCGGGRFLWPLPELKKRLLGRVFFIGFAGFHFRFRAGMRPRRTGLDAISCPVTSREPHSNDETLDIAFLPLDATRVVGPQRRRLGIATCTTPFQMENISHLSPISLCSSPQTTEK